MKDEMRQIWNYMEQKFAEVEEKVAPGARKIEKGEIVKVEDGQSTDYLIVDSSHESLADTFWFSDGTSLPRSEFENVQPYTSVARPEDTILVTNHISKSVRHIGLVGIVKEVHSQGDVVKLAEGGLFFHRSEFEIVARPAVADRDREFLFRRHNRILDEFKPGDIVKHPEYDMLASLTFINKDKLVSFEDGERYAKLDQVIPVVFVGDRLDRMETAEE